LSIHLLPLAKVMAVFAVPSCLVEFNIKNEPDRDFFERFVHTCFQTIIRRVSALTAISLDYNTLGAFISSTLAYNEHLYMKAPAGYDND